ncbi:MAG: phosphoglucosamine mutase [Phycisphaerae bacterium]|nr:phosphoglucosamine mutase [Phycisphaerae bacterium]
MDRLMVSVSGVRGTVGKTLTPRVAMEFGCAFGTMLGAGRTVTISRDTRPSGAMLRSAVAAGLTACGVNVVDLGVVTTPGAALMTRTLGCDGGVILTASHNPSPYNGIKFLQPSGPALPADQAERLKEIWRQGNFALQDSLHTGSESHNADTHETHVTAVCETVDPAAIAAGGFTAVLDSINGAGCAASPILLKRLGCKLVHLNAEPTGRFAHEPEPIEPNLGALGQAVLREKANVGFAQDPDADRLVLVDEQGRFIGEEYTLALAAAFVLRHRKGKLAVNLSTSRMIDDIAAAAGVEVVRAPTGEANVVEAMQREGCIFGGEGNGGVIDPRVVSVRDSLTGMAMILQYLAETGKPLSELVAAIPAYHLLKLKFPCPADAAAKVVEKTRAAFANRPGATFNNADGLRINLSDRWVSVRASNTEPIMRIFAEAPSRADAEALAGEVQALAQSVIGAG